MSSPLVDVSELAREVGSPDLVVVDVRWYLGRPGAGREAYLAGHIPSAIFLDLDDDLADLAGYGAPGRHPLPDPDVFAARLAAAGIRDASRVVAYDDVGGWVAARLWWMLDDLGFGTDPRPDRPPRRSRSVNGDVSERGGRVAVLDGGIVAWVAAGHPLEAGEASAKPARRDALHLRSRWTNVIDRDDLRDRLGSVVLLDARAAPRYRGETEPIDAVAGHIPTAVNAPIDGNLGPDGRFLPADALRARFGSLAASTAAGDEARVDVVTSCGSGTSAAHHSLAMRIAGLPDPILYVGSYSDWSRSGYPIATGADPGAAPSRRP